MNDLPGRGDLNPYGIPVPNPHERECPPELERELEEQVPMEDECPHCGAKYASHFAGAHDAMWTCPNGHEWRTPMMRDG